MSIRIRLRLFASLQKWLKNPPADFELADKTNVRSFILEQGIPEREIAIIIVNGKRGQLGDTLNDGDELRLFPLIGGG